MRSAHRFSSWVFVASAMLIALSVKAQPGHAVSAPHAVSHAQVYPVGHGAGYYPSYYRGGYGHSGFHGFYSVGFWNGCGSGWDWSWGPTACSPWGWGPYYDSSGLWLSAPPVTWVVREQATPASQGIPEPELYVYPSQRQSDEQLATDRYECHRWANGKTGFDPTRVDQTVTATEAGAQRENYYRAMTACLTGRGYSVK